MLQQVRFENNFILSKAVHEERLFEAKTKVTLQHQLEKQVTCILIIKKNIKKKSILFDKCYCFIYAGILDRL